MDIASCWESAVTENSGFAICSFTMVSTFCINSASMVLRLSMKASRLRLWSLCPSDALVLVKNAFILRFFSKRFSMRVYRSVALNGLVR